MSELQFWETTFFAVLNKTSVCSIHRAIEAADAALEAWRVRSPVINDLHSLHTVVAEISQSILRTAVGGNNVRQS